MRMRMYFLLAAAIFASSLGAQDTLVLSFPEYMGYVKRYHPLVKQANLIIEEGIAARMKARGGFDPKVEVDYDRKKFKGTEYYELLNATFKIPTWYGLEFKAGFEENEGVFLNPQNTVPEQGQFGAGLSFSVAQGLFINERMAMLKQAKIFLDQTEAQRDLLVNEVLYQASVAYFDWLKSYQEKKVYEAFLQNAKIRFEGTKRSVLVGDIAAIDSLEAGITVQMRKLNMEQADLEFLKSKLALSTFLWMEGNIPLELESLVVPDEDINTFIDQVFELQGWFWDTYLLSDNPKLQSLSYKVDILDVDRRLKANRLLPKLDLSYLFINDAENELRGLNTADYKVGFSFSFPLFLRKERGDLKLSRLKVQDARFELQSATLETQNKIQALDLEVQSLERQVALTTNVVKDYSTMLSAEERRFGIGESSVFLVNSRERSLIDSRLKLIELRNKYFHAKAKLFNTLATNPEGL